MNVNGVCDSVISKINQNDEDFTSRYEGFRMSNGMEKMSKTYSFVLSEDRFEIVD